MSEADARSVLGDELWEGLGAIIPDQPDQHSELRSKVADIIREYDDNRLLQEHCSDAKTEKARLASLSKHLDKSIAALITLPAHYLVAMQDLGSRGQEQRPGPIDNIISQLAALATGADRFLEVFEPPTGRPANYALEEAVRSLLRLFCQELGLELGIQWRKATGEEPQPSTPATRAIVLALRQVPNPPSVGAILNMVERVKDDIHNEARSPFDSVMRAHFDELDACLLTNRKERKNFPPINGFDVA